MQRLSCSREYNWNSSTESLTSLRHIASETTTKLHILKMQIVFIFPWSHGLICIFSF